MLVDLRSDTVTRPTAAMLKAMFQANVGDDVFGEDPTVNHLEAKTAALFGQEAGLFCPSGTMTNQIAINVHTRPGDEVICDATAHIYHYEGGGISRNSGAQARLLHGENGRITAQQIEDAINPSHDWLTRTRLVALENTGNKAGGICYKYQQMAEISATCRKRQLALHLDGARIFNALVHTGDAANSVGSLFDSISVCLSKGLGAPAGSVLLGSRDFITQARRVRKVMGGGMRQAGYLAAAGIYALDHHVERLAEDHQRTQKLAKTIAGLPYIKVLLPVETNILIFTLQDTFPVEKFMDHLNNNAVKAAVFGKQTIRFVMHLDVDDAMLKHTENVLQQFA
jgi:threonine aldolase